MSKKRKNKQKQKDTLKIEVSDIIESLQLSEKDMEELNNYIEQDIHRSHRNSFSKILTDQNLTLSQKLFISYIRGCVNNPNNYVNSQEYGKFIDLDAAEEFANDMYSGNTTEKIMTTTLNYMSKIMEFNKEDIELAIKDTVDERERKKMTELLEYLTKKKVLFDKSIEDWNTEIEEWKKITYK